MPQIDFGKALSNGKDASPRPGKIHLGEPPFETSNLSRWLHRFQLGRPEWANIIFTAVAVFGGLFCAFYFFNGADVVRSARNWPQEYFYARPVFMSPDAPPSIYDPAGLAKELVMRSAEQGSDNPFRRSTPLIASNPFLPPALPGAFGPLSSTGGMLPSGGNGGGGVPGSALPGPGQSPGQSQPSPGSLAPTDQVAVAASHSANKASHRGAMTSARRIAPKQSWLQRITLALSGKKPPTAGGKSRAIAAAGRTRALAVRSAHSNAQTGRGHASSRGATSPFGRSASQLARSGQSLSQSHARGITNRQNAGVLGTGSSALSSMSRGVGGMGSTGMGNAAGVGGGMGLTGSAAGVGSAARGGAPAGPGGGGGGPGLGGGFHGHGGGRH